MSARDEILRRVRQSQIAGDLPGDFVEGVRFDDPVRQFCEVLSSVGGKFAEASSRDTAKRIVGEVAAAVEAANVCSRVAEIDVSTFDPAGVTDPHRLEHVDLAVMPGRMGVAENAAVWVTAASPIERTLYFLAQHLVLIVPREAIVSNLHEAYERIDVASTAFGTWISGPSKTADIEQSLVLGAHGPRSLTVILVEKIDFPSLDQ